MPKVTYIRSIGEIYSQMPEASFRHEILPIPKNHICSGSNGEIGCQMPEAPFRHEISPFLKIIYVADQIGKFHVKCQNLSSDMKFPHF